MHIESNISTDNTGSEIGDTNTLFQRYCPMMHQKNRGDKVGEEDDSDRDWKIKVYGRHRFSKETKTKISIT